MQIQTVSYERKVSDGRYGNRAMAVSATLDVGEDPGPVLDDLAALVRDRLERDERAEEEQLARIAAAQQARYHAQQERHRAAWEADAAAEEDEDEEDDEGQEGWP